MEKVSLWAAIILPLFNIPLIIRIIQRRSSEDISTVWVMGVWVCALLMAPSGFASPDVVWRTYNIVNIILFTGVVIAVWAFRKKKNG